MATYYEANLTSVVPGLSNLFTSTDKVADRLLKAKNAMGVEVVKGKNVIAGEDFPVKEPLLSKLSVDQKLRIADLMDLVVGKATDSAGG